ncbi:MAG: FG-GAP repeat domain-containing protein [Cyclobacteriaceae bacterium]
MLYRFSIFIFIALLLACGSDKDIQLTTYFSQLPSTASGVSFSNDIVENDTLNYFTFPYLYMGGGVAVGGINNDGLSDIYLTGNMVPNRLYLNQGGNKFADISESAGIAGDDRWYTGATMADVNGDGWLDIYVSVSGKYTTTENQLFINNQDNTFSEQATEYGLNDASPSIQATFFDYDKDGFLDVYVATYPSIPVSLGNHAYQLLMNQNNLEKSGQ